MAKPDQNFNRDQQANRLQRNPAQPHSKDNEEIPITTSDIEDSIQLERREAYTEAQTQKLLRFLLENEKQEILPLFNPAAGFTYEIVSKIFDEKIPPQKTKDFLDRLTRLDILSKSFFDSVSTCPHCNSTSLTLHYRCQKCRSHNIIKTSLTEHIPCGYIAERERYVQGKCPKCGNPLMETEFRNMGRWYICRDCGEKFEDAEIDVICRKCGRVFNVDEAKSIEIPKYSLNPVRRKETRQNVASLESINKIISGIGFKTEMPGIMTGEKSGMQHHFSLIAKKQSPTGQDDPEVITIDHAVGETEVQASPLILYIYKISEIKVDLPIFVAIPKLNDTAKKIAQGHNILVIEGSPRDENEISNIRKRIENRLYHLDEVETGDENKGSMWKRPMLRREEKKPSLIDVIPSIHPDNLPPEEGKRKSFMTALKKPFSREKEEQESEKKS